VRLQETLIGELLYRRNHAGGNLATQKTNVTGAGSTERTSLAAKRTMMAADRSLMAWIRTGLSMISFGFTIYKLLEGFQESGATFTHASSPRNMGLFLTGLGTISLLMGTIEYWQRLKELRLLQHFRFWRPSFVIAMIMSVTGLFLFLSISLRAL
jgi:putative membrane protein